MREVDAEHPPQSLVVGSARRRCAETGDEAALPAAQQDALAAERLELVLVEQVVYNNEAVALESPDAYGHSVTSGPVSLSGFTIFS
jgi:hypothetical protein